MQEDHRQEPLILREKLLEAVDSDSNVRDVPLILEVLGKLESLPVTKEVLESTRLGKTVNDLRRKVKDAVLARRLKDLVKKWRDAVLVDPPQTQPTVNGSLPHSTTLEDGPGSGGGCPGPGGGVNLNRHNLISGYTSASSSPTLLSSRVVSPAGSYNSNNSLSPRIQIQGPGGPGSTSMTNFTNYSNVNNTSAHHPHHHSLPANRNGSSSIANRSPNNHHHHNKNLQISSSTSSFSTLVSPSAASSPHLNISRNLITPNKSKSPGGPILNAFSNNASSNLSPLPSSHFQSTSSSYAPNAETVSRTNAANKRFRETDDSSLSGSVEPPLKRSRTTGVNGTLDDPMLALDEISRDSYASRGSDHSDGFTSNKDHRFSSSTLSPATPGQTSTLSPQMPVPATDSNAPSPVQQQELEVCTSTSISTITPSSQLQLQTQTSEPQPKKKGRRKKQNEFYQDNEAILREKIAQAEAEKAAKAAREREQKEKEQSLPNAGFQDAANTRQRYLEESLVPEENLAKNEFVNKYLKSQNELRAEMERDAVDVLASSGEVLNGPDTGLNIGSKKIKGKHKHKGKLEALGTAGADISSSFPSESEILAQLPPIDPELLKEFANFEYDVNPSPPPQTSQLSEEGVKVESDPYNKETEGMQSLSTTTTPEKKPPLKFIDWGDSDEEEEPPPPPPTNTEVVQIKSEPPSPIPPKAPEIDSHSLEENEENERLSLPFHRGDNYIVEDEEVERYITDKLPNLNGNYDKDGEFREWHETLTVESYKQEPLHILPYTIIDF